MSMMLMVQAMKIKVGNPTRKLVLIKLADNANDAGECWPSYQNIADHCEVTRRSVMSHIKALEQAGYLTREYRKGEKGNSSNLYHLNLSGGENISLGGENRSLPPSENISPRTSHSLEPVNEPKDHGSSSDKPSPKKRMVYPPEFEWIWKNKPEREGGNPKKGAYHACNASIKRGATWRELAEGMRRYKAYCIQKGTIGTDKVQQMKTFFGPDEHFKEEWTVNHAANQRAATQPKLSPAEQYREKLKAKYANDRASGASDRSQGLDQPDDAGDLREPMAEPERPTYELDAGDWQDVSGSD